MVISASWRPLLLNDAPPRRRRKSIDARDLRQLEPYAFRVVSLISQEAKSMHKFRLEFLNIRKMEPVNG